MTITILPAKAQYAEPMLKLRRASIVELCYPDHGNEAEQLSEWADNKTLDNMRALIESPDSHMIIAKLESEIAGMGSVSQQGRILMNYVDPEFRFRGVSKAIMAALEDYIRSLGLRQATLESSKTAYEFYQACGWQTVETDDDKIEMIKIL